MDSTLVAGTSESDRLDTDWKGETIDFEIYRSGTDFRWRLKAANHEIIAQGESYTTKANCENAIRLVKGSSTAPTYER